MKNNANAPMQGRRAIREMAAYAAGLAAVGHRPAVRDLAQRLMASQSLVDEFESIDVERISDPPHIGPEHVVHILGFDDLARNVALCLADHGIRDVDFLVDEPAMDHRSAIRSAIRMGFTVYFAGDKPPHRAPDYIIDCMNPNPPEPRLQPSILVEIWPDCPVAASLIAKWGEKLL